jgi:hypothetical protein
MPMPTDDLSDAQPLRDAALVHAASRQIRAALADLAARPLDEAAAEQMRLVLVRQTGRVEDARAALQRLERMPAEGATDLRLVRTDGGERCSADWEAPPTSDTVRRPSTEGVA